MRYVIHRLQLKGKKKLILTDVNGQEYVFKKKSKECEKRSDRLTVEDDPAYIGKETAQYSNFELNFEGNFLDEYSSGAMIRKEEDGYYIEYGIYRLTTFYGKGYIENEKLIFEADENDVKMEFTLNSDGSELAVLVIESDFEYYPVGTTGNFPRAE